MKNEIQKTTIETPSALIKHFDLDSMEEFIQIEEIENKPDKNRYPVRVEKPTIIFILEMQNGNSTFEMNGVSKKTEKDKPFKLNRGDTYFLFGNIKILVISIDMPNKDGIKNY